MRVTHVSRGGSLLDVVVRISDDDTIVGARDWLRTVLGVESGVGMVTAFPPNRVVLSVPVTLEAKVNSMVDREA